MLKIRLRRTGAKKQPRYRVVVAESSAPRDGAYVEVLGWYNPQADPAQVVVNTDKATEWIRRGAQPSDRVAYLLKQAGLGQPAVAPPDEAAEASAAKPALRRRASAGTTAKATATDEVEPASTETQPEPAGAALAEKPAPRRRATARTAAAEQPASEAPESEGSAGVVESADTQTVPTDAPESEGSAGATPA